MSFNGCLIKAFRNEVLYLIDLDAPTTACFGSLCTSKWAKTSAIFILSPQIGHAVRPSSRHPVSNSSFDLLRIWRLTRLEIIISFIIDYRF